MAVNRVIQERAKSSPDLQNALDNDFLKVLSDFLHNNPDFVWWDQPGSQIVMDFDTPPEQSYRRRSSLPSEASSLDLTYPEAEEIVIPTASYVPRSKLLLDKVKTFIDYVRKGETTAMEALEAVALRFREARSYGNFARKRKRSRRRKKRSRRKKRG